MKVSKADKEQAIADLREMLRPGDTVYTTLKRVSSSGMSREITPMILISRLENVVKRALRDSRDAVTLGEREVQPYYLGYLASKALGLKVEDQTVRMSGAGMDMGFALVYELSHATFPDGFDCAGETCPANDHANVRNETCPICGTALEREHFATVIERDPDQPWYDRRDWRGIDPLYVRANRREPVGCCSQECADKVWHHADGGYALKHKWL